VLTSHRSRSLFPRGWWHPRGLPLYGVAGGLLAGGVGYWYARGWRRKHGAKPPASEGRSPSALLATELYEMLDGAMSAQGLARSPGTPPLRHAESPATKAHPLGDEILKLTDVYLRARFGGELITEEGRKAFELRVKAVRAARPGARE
jgi:protein-glutamine gamma-glutamyltransferase